MQKKEVAQPCLPSRIENIIALNRAGSPTDPQVKWTHLKPCDIAVHYKEQWNESISHRTVKRILKTLGSKYMTKT